MIKKEAFDSDLQELSEFAKAISHPARLAILKYLSETKICISGDISDQLPLSRTTVSQHLRELKRVGLIHGSIDGVKINYCICADKTREYLAKFDQFFTLVKNTEINCSTQSK